MKGMNWIRNCCCFIVLCLFALDVSAQVAPSGSIHFQTENNQAFDVKWNGRSFSSSSTGYLVLPQVTAGSQSLVIIFGGEEVEYTFTLAMQNEPKGYSLRQAIDNSWSLFDMVELTMTKGGFTGPIAKTVIPEKMPTPIPAPAVADKPVEKIPVKFIETPEVKTALPVVPKQKLPALTEILKIFDKSGNTGIDQVYVLTNGTRSDTIALFIPALTEEIPKSGTNPAALLTTKGDSAVILAGRAQPAIRQRNPSISK
jgi:hypothetical protein